ncbi:MAG: hypothetical protein Q8M76_18945, partial [Spirochaetaceae bacterium]|nr:hypothetical protein [Spirochaetaceae bacterium]
MARNAAGAGYTPEQTAVIHGSIHQPARKTLRYASRSIGLSRALSLTAVRGDVIHGPRIGGGSRVAQVVRPSDTTSALYLDDQLVLQTGDSTPAENSVMGFSGPIVGRDGLLHFCVMTNHGTELCLFDGQEVHTLFLVGARLEGSSERIVSIDFGSVRSMVNGLGRLVFLATSESGKKTVVLGIPV